MFVCANSWQSNTYSFRKMKLFLLLYPSVAITFQRCKGKSQLSNDLGIRYGLSKIFLSLLARVFG